MYFNQVQVQVLGVMHGFTNFTSATRSSVLCERFIPRRAYWVSSMASYSDTTPCRASTLLTSLPWKWVIMSADTVLHIRSVTCLIALTRATKISRLSSTKADRHSMALWWCAWRNNMPGSAEMSVYALVISYFYCRSSHCSCCMSMCDVTHKGALF